MMALSRPGAAYRVTAAPVVAVASPCAAVDALALTISDRKMRMRISVNNPAYNGPLYRLKIGTMLAQIGETATGRKHIYHER